MDATPATVPRSSRGLAQARDEMAERFKGVEGGLLVDADDLRRWIEIIDDEIKQRGCPPLVELLTELGELIDAPAEF